ncbi:hypothetical protein [Pseudopedobacter beijingensis]|uniref:Lipoprotein n=1 Tax=Pseudopedobacter beijingensis TaxID=1207056 RepID=A0ABW4I9Q9_9SPHI
MNRIFTSLTLAVFSVIFLASCAGGYNFIKPQQAVYTEPDTGLLKLSYKYDVLRAAGNKKYVKREINSNIRLVSLKITNNDSRSVKFLRDFAIYSDHDFLNVIPLDVVHTQLKQRAPLYLLYLLLTPAKLYKTEMQTNGIAKNETIFPVGLIIGPGIALGNMIRANSANNKFKKELIEYNLFDREIKAGETVYFIIGIKEGGFRPLSIKKI